MFCSQCGNELSDGFRFCPGCGEQIIPSEDPSEDTDLEQPRTAAMRQDADYWYHRALTLTEDSESLECLQCLKRAVEADPSHVQALYAIGHHYFHGQGTKADKPNAAVWLRRSADLGFAPAQDKLGLMYEHGLGVAKNATEAVKCYALAAPGGAPRRPVPPRRDVRDRERCSH